MMKRLFFLLLLFPAFSQAQNYAKLYLTNVSIVVNGKENYNGPDQTFELQAGKNDRGNTLIDVNGIRINADFKITTNNSRRSSVKTGAINVWTTYKLEMGGGKDKRTTERIFYLDDSRSFDCTENFVIKDGLHSKQVKLTYKARLD